MGLFAHEASAKNKVAEMVIRSDDHLHAIPFLWGIGAKAPSFQLIPSGSAAAGATVTVEFQTCCCLGMALEEASISRFLAALNVEAAGCWQARVLGLASSVAKVAEFRGVEPEDNSARRAG